MNEELYHDHESHFWKVTKNAAQCLQCNDVIESKHRHDYVTCECGAVSVDGGIDYLKRSGSFGIIKELSESAKFTKTELDDYISYYSRQQKNSSIFSDTYYVNTIKSAKYFRNLWYPDYSGP